MQDLGSRHWQIASRSQIFFSRILLIELFPVKLIDQAADASD